VRGGKSRSRYNWKTTRESKGPSRKTSIVTAKSKFNLLFLRVRRRKDMKMKMKMMMMWYEPMCHKTE
jgi:hypothetical protein